MANLGDYGNTIGPLARIDYAAMHAEKVSRAREQMAAHGLGAIVCLADTNFEYVTNVPMMSGTAQGIGGNRYAVLPEDGRPIAFEESDTAYHMQQVLPDYTEVRKAVPLPPGGVWAASAPGARRHLEETFATQIAGLLDELGLAAEPVGIDQNNPTLIGALEAEGLEVSTAGAGALLEARRIKTREEQEHVRKLAGIIDGAFARMAETVRPGVTEREVYGECVKFAIEHGLTPDGGHLQSGPHTWPKDVTKAASDRLIRPGDTVYADFFNWGCFGYRSCYYRTFSVGPASREVREAHDRAVEWLEDAEAAIQPGATTKEVVANWPDEVELWSDRPPYVGTHEEALSTFFNNMGHGIGLSLYEPPFFWHPTSDRWPQEIEAGMTIAIETQEATPDNSRGVRIEDMLLVTDDGPELLSKWPKDSITELPLY